MPDLYIYNGTAQFFDASASIDDMVFRRNTIIPQIAR